MVGRPLSQGRAPTHAVITRATWPKRRPKARVAAEIPPIQIATDNLEFDLVLNRLDRFLSSFAPTILNQTRNRRAWTIQMRVGGPGNTGASGSGARAMSFVPCGKLKSRTPPPHKEIRRETSDCSGEVILARQESTRRPTGSRLPFPAPWLSSSRRLPGGRPLSGLRRMTLKRRLRSLHCFP